MKPIITAIRAYLQKVAPFFLLFMLVQSCLRSIFIIREYAHLDVSFFSFSLLCCMFSGCFYDALAFFYLLIPLVVLLVFLPQNISKSLIATSFLSLSYFLFCYVLLLIAVAEWFFWDEFHARFNFIAVDYLIYTRIVAQYIKEAYPVIPILVGIGCCALMLSSFYFIRQKNHWQKLLMPHFSMRMLICLTSIAVACFIFLSVKENILYQKSNRYLNEISKNGIFAFFKAYSHNDLPFQQFYVMRNQHMLSRLLQQQLNASNSTTHIPEGLQDVDRRRRGEIESESTRRKRHILKGDGYTSPLYRYITALSGHEKKYNVVMVVMESMSAQYLKPFQQRFGLTPHLDALANDSLLFSNVYATGTRTVYGLSAIALSIPPIPGNAILRRPHNEHLFTLGSVLRHKGYITKFIYGGYGYFDNMNYFFQNNGYQVIDRRHFEKQEITFANVWGISDEDVFNRVLKENDHAHQQRQPFFDLIMTTSNHRPFTYPAGKISIPSGSGREGGLNYADYAIGAFMQKAKQRPWFDHTIFVFVADHTADNAGRNELSVSHYHIPLLFYAPKLLKPRTVTTLASQIDVAPTLLGLLNMSYHSQFFGHNILTTHYERAFISNYQKLGFLTPTQLMILQPTKQIHAYRRSADQFTDDKQAHEALLQEALSYFQTATHWQQWNKEVTLKRSKATF